MASQRMAMELFDDADGDILFEKERASAIPINFLVGRATLLRSHAAGSAGATPTLWVQVDAAFCNVVSNRGRVFPLLDRYFGVPEMPWSGG